MPHGDGRSWSRWVRAADAAVFGLGIIALLVAIVALSRANIVADSVDYYAILQRMATPGDTPVVRNVHFVEQRSPGYPLLALPPYVVLDSTVARLVDTEQVSPPESTEPHPSPPAPLPGERGAGAERGRGEGGPPGGGMGPGPPIMPSAPIRFLDVPFRDFSIPSEGSWYRWGLALALALTSYSFLFAGLAASAKALKWLAPSFPGYSLAVAVVFLSPGFAEAVVMRPLYATLAAYGLAALFALYFCTGYATGATGRLVAAGVFLGLLVLTRLEIGVLAAMLFVLLAFRREWRTAAVLAAAAAPSAIAWIAYNLLFFGRPVALGMLRGDINRAALNLGYVADSLVHPASGIVFWSPLVVLGVVGLVASRSIPLRLLGWSSLALVVVYLIRVPLMYGAAPGAVLDIGGLPVPVPDSPAAMHEMIRGDTNRYMVTIAPFGVIGLRDGLQRILGTRRAQGAGGE